MWRSVLLLCLGVFVSGGCYGSEITPFPPGLEPLEANTAPRASGSSSDPYPETLSMVSGDDPYSWAHARGYIKAPAAKVWAALKEGETVVDSGGTDRHTIRYGTEPDYAWSMEVDFLVENIIDVEWTEGWRYGLVEGSEADPRLAMVRYQKIEGITLIDRLEGSILVRAITPSVSEIELVRHLDAFMASTSDVRRYLSEVYPRIAARAKVIELPAP